MHLPEDTARQADLETTRRSLHPTTGHHGCTTMIIVIQPQEISRPVALTELLSNLIVVWVVFHRNCCSHMFETSLPLRKHRNKIIKTIIHSLKKSTVFASNRRHPAVFVGITQVEIDALRIESPLTERRQSAQAQLMAPHAATTRPKHFLEVAFQLRHSAPVDKRVAGELKVRE